MTRKRMKLFVYTDFCPDYSSGLAVALAHTEDEARKQIEAYRGYKVYDWGTLAVFPVSRKMAQCVSGGS